METRNHCNFSSFFPSPRKIIKPLPDPVGIPGVHFGVPGSLTFAIHLVGSWHLNSGVLQVVGGPIPSAPNLPMVGHWVFACRVRLPCLLTTETCTPTAAAGDTLFHSWPYSWSLETAHLAAFRFLYFRAHKLNSAYIFLVKPPCS